MNLILRKGTVKSKIKEGEFFVIDFFNKEEFTMNHSLNPSKKPEVNIGDIVYVIVSPFDKKRGRLATSTYFRGDNSSNFIGQKAELDKK